ncbi:hypothetical protein KFU94_54795 [Chloroflexi bacterium TSY]|nr:hypothetical protein [Chloroflexi bacterium TSY]
MIRHYRDLQDWQKAMNVAVAAYELTKSLLETQLELALRVGYLSQEASQNVLRELDILGKQLNVLSQRVNQPPTTNN